MNKVDREREPPPQRTDVMSILMVTSLGDMVIDLHTEKCPLTCKNFLKLCKSVFSIILLSFSFFFHIIMYANIVVVIRIKYYNGCLFHTVQKDFTAQTGDPTGTGTAGDSIYK